jgi:ADP-ribosylglycohydrolase
MKSDYLNKFKGTLIGLTIGDILAHPFRGKLRTEIASEFNFFENNEDFEEFEKFLLNNKRKFKTYTNNTQLALHLSEALIKANGFDIKQILREFLIWMEDPPIGSCYGTLSTMKKIKNGVLWNKAASNSGGSGTLSRAVPIGLYYNKDLNQLRIAAKKSSSLTHTHPAASIGAIILARTIAYLLTKTKETGFSIDDFSKELISSISNSAINDKIKEEYIENLNKLTSNLSISVQSGLIKFSQIGVNSPYFIEDYLGKAFIHPYVMSTVLCSLFLFLKNRASFKKCILNFASTGGGSTVGAVGGALAGAYFGYSEIPHNLLKFLKNRKKILTIAERLFNKFETKIYK